MSTSLLLLIQFLMTINFDLSLSPSKEDEEHPVTIIPPTLSNDDIPNCNIRNNNLNGAACDVFDGNTDSRSTGTSNGRLQRSINTPGEENLPMTPLLLKVLAGVDIIDWVVSFAKSRKVFIIVLYGSGKISEMTLIHKRSQTPPLLYKEHLNLNSISGAYMFTHSGEGYSFFNVLVNKANGAVIGGATSRMISMDVIVLLHMFSIIP
ncbi:PPC domain-containing protein [Heracleum sosnowskyi]|uniref:AT-hook motif nuclear-localized protein n=1 Tax=Heracleum sosnowskyi TaxID=360622 RepID=A0AAD8GP90_9APIA|nr:PPC domain-containing protein [Heracleum sosnowskyi]